MKFQPILDQVLIERIEVKQIGSIYVPDSLKAQLSTTGTVLEVGPGIHKDGHFQEMPVKVGDKVYFTAYSPNEIDLDGKKLFVVHQNQILGIVTE